jgi:hypothetical protein
LGLALSRLPAEYGRAHYAANRDLYKRRAIAFKHRALRERTEFLFAYFEAHPCQDCGEADPVAL